MQISIVILVVAGSALYAAARLLPAAVVERVLRAVDAAAPRWAPALRRFAGRPRGAAGAPGACSGCSAAATHAPARAARQSLTKS